MELFIVYKLQHFLELTRIASKGTVDKLVSILLILYIAHAFLVYVGNLKILSIFESLHDGHMLPSQS